MISKTGRLWSTAIGPFRRIQSVSEETQNCSDIFAQITPQRFGVALTEAFPGLDRIADVIWNREIFTSSFLLGAHLDHLLLFRP